MAGSDEEAVAIRALLTPEEMREAVELQWETWGPEDSTPANQLVISVKTGGHVFGAFSGGRMIAFLYGFPAVLPGQAPWLASHMLATRKGHEGRGIGRTLKWRQREWALARGFSRITWTFDPLEARNCHLNLNVLGAVGGEYVVNCYGSMDDKLNHGLPSDRLVAHWELMSDRVEAAVAGRPLPPPPADALRVAIPREFQAVKGQSLADALGERLRVRAALEPAMAAGGRIVGYDRERSELVVARAAGG